MRFRLTTCLFAAALAFGAVGISTAVTGCGVMDQGNIDRLDRDWRAFEATLPADLLDMARFIAEDIRAGDYLGAVTMLVNLIPQITQPDQLAAARLVWQDLVRLVTGKEGAAELIAEGNAKLARKQLQLQGR